MNRQHHLTATRREAVERERFPRITTPIRALTPGLWPPCSICHRELSDCECEDER